MSRKTLRQDESGQAVVEYILLLALVVSTFSLINAGFKRFDVGGKLLRPVKGSFAATYQYGHPEAKGGDSFEFHPRKPPGSGKENFRLFINPAER